MKAEELLHLRWKQVRNWSGLTSVTKENGDKFVCRKDLDSFEKERYQSIAVQLEIPYEELEPVLKKKNQTFYSLKEALFREKYEYSILDIKIIQLQNTFKIPDLSDVDIHTETESNAELKELCEEIWKEFQIINRIYRFR